MSQTLMSPAAALDVSPRLARFGVAMIALIVAACFAVLVAARGDRPPTPPAAPAAAIDAAH